MATVLLACFVLLVALGSFERLAARRARAAVPIRIHVNGTRGKSTVTRLVAAALREAGVPTVAKVTGASPRLIRPDGSEQPIRRWAPANIREQAWLLREARRAGARALVVECMAIRPDLQRVSEHEMVRATVGVITNARLDHGEVMGTRVEDVAQSLANAIPRGGVLVTGDGRFADLFAARCAALGTRLVIATQEMAGGDPSTRFARSGQGGGEHGRASVNMWDPASLRLRSGQAAGTEWLREDLAVALAVTRELGIKDEVAMSGMLEAAADPGAVKSGNATVGSREVAWIDATAANDPESLDLLATAPLAGTPTLATPPPWPPVVVYNHRGDRADRLRSFARHSVVFRSGVAILLTGDRPALTLAAAVRRQCPGATVSFVPSRHLAAQIAREATDRAARRIVFCGNTRGWANPIATDPSTRFGRPAQAATNFDQRPMTNDHDQ